MYRILLALFLALFTGSICLPEGNVPITASAQEQKEDHKPGEERLELIGHTRQQIRGNKSCLFFVQKPLIPHRLAVPFVVNVSFQIPIFLMNRSFRC